MKSLPKSTIELKLYQTELWIRAYKQKTYQAHMILPMKIWW